MQIPPLPFHLDSDLLVLVAGIGRALAYGLPTGSRISRVIPREFRFQILEPQELTPKQLQFFEKHDAALAKLGYHPVVTFRTTNYGTNLIRRYFNPVDPASCAVVVTEIRVQVKGVTSARHTETISFLTEFADRRRLTTRNMQLRTLLDHQPEASVQECPGTSDPAVLKRRHDSRAAGMGAPVAPPSDSKSVFEKLQAEHVRFTDYQLARGNYRAVTGGYTISAKVRWRGIRNHLIPFAQYLSPWRLALAAVIAIGLPALISLKLAPLAASQVAGVSPELVRLTMLGGGYICAGAVIGLLLDTSRFQWCYLFTYFGVRLFTGWWTSPVPFSAIASIVAHRSAQWRQGRKLLLEGKVETPTQVSSR